MVTRRTLTFLVLALALIAPAAALADKSPPKRAVPKLLLTLTDGAVNSKTVSPVIQTTFTPPVGTTPGAACKGKVAVSVPIGKKTVKKKKKTIYVIKKSTVRAAQGICTANTMLALPAKFFGTTQKFTVAYAGNGVVKKFKKTFKLAIVLPPKPPAGPTFFDLQKGPWTATETGTPVQRRQWTFSIGADNSVPAMPRYGEITVNCPDHGPVFLHYSPQSPLGVFDTPFTLNANDFTATDENVNADEHSLLTMKFHFDSATHGTGTFQVTGTFRAPSLILVPADLVPGCSSDVIPFELRAGAAV